MQQVRRQLEELSNSLRQLEGTTNGSNQALAESIIRYQKASREAISLKAEFKALQRSGEGNEEMFRSLSERIELAQNKEREAIEDTRRLAAAFQNSSQEAEQFSNDMRFLNEQLDKSQGHIDGVSVAAKRQEAAIQGVTTEVKQQTGELKQLNQTNERVASGMSETARETKRAGDALDDMNRKGQSTVAFGNILAEMFEEALYAVKQFAQESVQEFFDFDRGMREIATLVPDSTQTMREEMGEDIQALSIDLGRMSEEMLPAVYQALSSGRGTETVLEDVALASEAARASVGELEGTMTSGLAVLNAYGEGTYSLQQIYDQFFYGIKEGVFTMDDLAGGMSALTSISAETKTPLEDIMAALVVMTRQGDSFNEAVELSGLLLTQLGTEGSAAAKAFTDATGQSYREFIAQGGTLAEALQEIQDHAAATGTTMGEMIAGNSPFFRDQQAARAALELTGVHLQELTDFAEGARNAQGSMAEASAIMGDAAETSANQAKAGFDVLKAKAGEFLLNFDFIAMEVKEDGATIGNAISGLIPIMEATTGSMAQEAEDIIESNIAQADSVQDLIREYQKLEEVDDMYLGLGDTITGTTEEIKSGQDQIKTALALSIDSFEEYMQALKAAGVSATELASIDTVRAYYDQARAATELAEATAQEVEEKQASIAVMRDAAAIRTQENAAIIAQTTALNDNIHAYGDFELSSEGVNASLTRQSVAYQEGIHGLDIYREGLMYAGDQAIETGAEIEVTTETINTQAQELAGYWMQAGTLVDGWIAAQDRGKTAILAANGEISASYNDVFFDALLASQGLTAETMNLMVAAGLLTQEEADLRLEIAENSNALTQLASSSQFAKLTTDEQLVAMEALKSGMVQTAEGAIALATNGYNATLTPALRDAKLEALALQTPLDTMATMHVAPTFQAPDLSGAISQAERLKQLLSDLGSQGSAGGYGGYQNEDGGVQGGGNLPGNATGTSYFEGGLSWVGEQGPELVSLPRGTQIYNNRESRAMSSKTVNIGGDTFIMNNRGQDEAQAAAQIVATRRRERMNAAARIS